MYIAMISCAILNLLTCKLETILTSLCLESKVGALFSPLYGSNCSNDKMYQASNGHATQSTNDDYDSSYYVSDDKILVSRVTTVSL